MKREGIALQLEGTAYAKGLSREGHTRRGREKACVLDWVEACLLRTGLCRAL